MKKIIYSIVLSILVLYILFSPQEAIQAASFGLVLWYTKMLPTLLPFAILSYIFVVSGLLNNAARLLHKFIRKIIPVSVSGIYPLFAGFLFGFPLGSQITAQLVDEHQMDIEEGNRLFPICNNISPVFISGFIMTTSLKRPDLTVVTLFILYLPPLLYYILNVHLTQKNYRPDITSQKKAAPGSQINFKIIDAGIMSGFETLTKLGGYIMLFAILAQMTKSLPIHNSILSSLLVGTIEITNGIAYIATTPLSFETKYLLSVFCTAFGGLSGFAQTASMVRKAGLSMRNYVKVKCICSLLSVLLSGLYVNLLF